MKKIKRHLTMLLTLLSMPSFAHASTDINPMPAYVPASNINQTYPYQSNVPVQTQYVQPVYQTPPQINYHYTAPMPNYIPPSQQVSNPQQTPIIVNINTTEKQLKKEKSMPKGPIERDKQYSECSAGEKIGKTVGTPLRAIGGFLSLIAGACFWAFYQLNKHTTLKVEVNVNSNKPEPDPEKILNVSLLAGGAATGIPGVPMFLIGDAMVPKTTKKVPEENEIKKDNIKKDDTKNELSKINADSNQPGLKDAKVKLNSNFGDDKSKN